MANKMSTDAKSYITLSPIQPPSVTAEALSDIIYSASLLWVAGVCAPRQVERTKVEWPSCPNETLSSSCPVKCQHDYVEQLSAFSDGERQTGAGWCTISTGCQQVRAHSGRVREEMCPAHPWKVCCQFSAGQNMQAMLSFAIGCMQEASLSVDGPNRNGTHFTVLLRSIDLVPAVVRNLGSTPFLESKRMRF